MNRIKIILFFFSVLLFWSCKKEHGILVTEDRMAAPIKKIMIDHRINLTLTQDTIEGIQVIAGADVISAVITNISDSILTIENKDNSSINSPGKQIEVKVRVKNLETIEYQGSGNIISTNKLLSSNFTVVSTKGAGIINLDIKTGHLVAGIYEENSDLIFSGEANSAFVYCSSRGTIDMRNIKVKTLNIIYSSVRNGYIWATDSLTGILYHTGNVFYKGNPLVQKQELSSGKFLNL